MLAKGGATVEALVRGGVNVEPDCGVKRGCGVGVALQSGVMQQGSAGLRNIVQKEAML